MKKIIFIIITLGLGYYFSQSFFTSKKINNAEINQNVDPKIKPQDTNTPPPEKNTSNINSSNHSGHDHGSSDEGFEVEVLEIPKDEAGQALLSLAEITDTFANREVNVNSLKETLSKNGLKVVSTVDTNKYTGSLTVIRTNNSLPGTRYFHAQVFTDENGKDFVQHMSYEYKPSEKSFAEAVAVVKQAFKLTKVADVRKDGFYSWNTDDGYITWIKRMEKEDLVDDPYNAYTDADIGTIKITREIEIH